MIVLISLYHRIFDCFDNKAATYIYIFDINLGCIRCGNDSFNDINPLATFMFNTAHGPLNKVKMSPY